MSVTNTEDARGEREELPERSRNPSLLFKGDDYRAEQLMRLRRSRSGYLANLTRLQTELINSINCGATEEVEDKLRKVQAAFADFGVAHHSYMDLAYTMEPQEARNCEEHYDFLTRRIHDLELRVSAMYPMPQVTPEDSVSQAGGHSTSSTSTRVSSRVKVAAKKAALMVKAESLKQQQELELQLQKSRQTLERLKLEAEISAAAAEEDTILKMTGYEGSRTSVSPDQNDITQTPLSSHPGIQRTLATMKASDDTSPTQMYRERPVLPDSQPKATRLRPEASEYIAGQGRTQLQGPVLSTPVISDGGANHIKDPMKDLAEAFKDLTMSARLPVPEPTVFTGDPLRYADWEASFQALVHQKGIPAEERMHYLRKYLAGPAKEAVEGYFFVPSPYAYEEARSLLQKRFGTPFVIAHAFKKKLEGWPKIGPRDFQGLRKFSDFLHQCIAALGSYGGLDVLDSELENAKILTKLPERLMFSWGRLTIDYQDRYGRFPPFMEFCRFVHQESEIVCNPILMTITEQHSPGTQKDSSQKNTQKRSDSRPRGSALKTEAKLPKEKSKPESPSPELSCHLCSGPHLIDDCPKFLSLSLEERQETAKKKGLCFGCLRKGHLTKNCRNRAHCATCKRRHPTTLHWEKKAEELKKDDPTEAVTHTSKASLLDSVGKSSLILPVWVSHQDEPEREELLYALLDTQSDTTFVSDAACDLLGIEGVPTTLMLTTMTSKNQRINSKRVSGLSVRGHNCDKKIFLPTAFTRESIPANRDHIPTPDTIERWPHLQSISDQLLPLSDCEVGLLIGYNCPQALAPQEVLLPPTKGPFAQKTDLGWGVVGIVDPISTEADKLDNFGVSHRVLTYQVLTADAEDRHMNEVQFVHKNTVKEVLPSDILRALDGEFTVGTGDEEFVSQDDIQFVTMMDEQVHQNEDGYYEMPLPFKERPHLPNNIVLARQRLLGLKKKLLKNSDFYKEYRTFMTNVIENGEAEEVPPGDVEKGDAWYIPHHGVYHPQKKKLRVVFDASARFQDQSLNDHLLQGPDQLNNLAGLLCRFRKSPVAFTCDIERMFYQFYVNPEDRDFLRFLWWKDGDLDQDISVFRIKVHIFGATSSPACALYGMRRIALDHQDEFSEAATQFIAKEFYMDDGLKSVELPAEAIEIINEARELCQKGNLRLHKFASNNQQVLDSLPDTEKTKTLSKDLTEEHMERTLGLQWSLEGDQFQFKVAAKDSVVTRRGILSTVASLYDPLGLVAPFTLVGKQILQQMCRQNIGWDDPVPADLSDEWTKWRRDLENLDLIKIDRCFQPQGFGEIVKTEVHHFSDASFQGYGHCSYLRLVNAKGDVHCSLIMGKSRVAPKKTMTIPRMELCAAVLSVKVARFLRSELKMNYDEYFWTDSQIVLAYINNKSRRFHVFVANRVQHICDLSKEEQWHYVPSEDNPADHASRGLGVSALLSSNWNVGPEFLRTPTLEMPDNEHVEIRDDDPEVKTKFVFAMQAKQPDPILQRLEKFSDWDRAVRALARLRRFVKFKIGKAADLNGCLSVEEIEEMKEEIIRRAQRDSFPEGIKTNSIGKLDPFVDEKGVLRVGGRLSRSSLGYKEKHPVIIPKGHIANLLARHHHERVGHQGRGMTISAIRDSGLWLIGCSGRVSSLIYKCVVCRKLRGTRQDQKMSSLPEMRTESTPPFTYVGMDCFGPFLIKDGRKEHKRYGLLFTCMSSRAVHIEVLDDMTTDSFLNGLRCLIAIRGPVRTLFCDKGTNFVGAANELALSWKQVKDEKVRDFLLSQQCDFHMNTPCSSHMGGTWERQIRTVRSSLQGLLQVHGGRLDTTTLRTLMYEAMAIVNSRPLGFETLNDPCSLAPISPNQLLTMKSHVVVPPPGDFVVQDVYARKRWRKVQFLANEFWRRWRSEYLQQLQLRQKWTKERREIRVGDIVVLKEDDLVRNHWRIARVIDVKPGEDGHVRKVSLRMSDSSVLDRPIHKLVVLVENNEDV